MQIEVFDKETAEYLSEQIIKIVPQEGRHGRLKSNLRIFVEGELEIELYCTFQLFRLLSSMRTIKSKFQV